MPRGGTLLNDGFPSGSGKRSATAVASRHPSDGRDFQEREVEDL